MNILTMRMPVSDPSAEHTANETTDLSTWYVNFVKYSALEYEKHKHPNAYGIVFEQLRESENNAVLSVQGQTQDKFGLLIYCQPRELLNDELIDHIDSLITNLKGFELLHDLDGAPVHFVLPTGWTLYMYGYDGDTSMFELMVDALAQDVAIARPRLTVV